MTVVCAWCQQKMGEIEPIESDAVSHGICPTCLAKQQAAIREIKPMRNHPRKGSPEAFAWARRMQAARQRKPATRKNPGAAYHVQEAEQAEQAETVARRKGNTVSASFQRGKAVAHRQSEMKARDLKMNPIAVFGNPPKRVNAAVAGVIYNRVIEIRAEKTTHKPGYYRHPFNRTSQAQILGLDNGDLLIHSISGKRLWGEDGDL